MGHGQARGGQFARGDGDHHPGAAAIVAPTGGFIGVAAGAGPGGNAVFEG